MYSAAVPPVIVLGERRNMRGILQPSKSARGAWLTFSTRLPRTSNGSLTANGRAAQAGHGANRCVPESRPVRIMVTIVSVTRERPAFELGIAAKVFCKAGLCSDD